MTLAALLLAGAASAGESRASDTAETRAGLGGQAQFGASNTVAGQISKDDRVDAPLLDDESVQSFIQPWFDFKGRVKGRIGLALGVDYNVLGQVADDSPGDLGAVGGVARFFGQWSLLGREMGHTGALVFKGEQRHRIGTNVAPALFGGELGWVGGTAGNFTDAGWVLTNLYWQQNLARERVAFVFGVVDTTDYVDTYSLVNPWETFFNTGFLNSPTIPLPGQGLGAAGRIRIAGGVYVEAGVADLNGDPAKPEQTFQRFFSRGEVLVHAELGWAPSWERRFTDGIHVMGWYATARAEPATPSGWGLAFSYNRLLADRFEPFVRAGYSEGGGAVMMGAVSVGLAVAMRGRSDQLGVGLGWARPNDEVYGPANDQYTVEVYYRLKLLQNLDVTPDLQVLVDPVQNPDQAVIAVFGLRARVKF